MKFEEFLEMYRKQHTPGWEPPEYLLVLDPGETLGWAQFTQGSLTDSGELSLMYVDTFAAIKQLMFDKELRYPDVIVTENYKVYPWKLKEHAWGTLFTVKIIGLIEALAVTNKVPLFAQMANMAKGFCKDKKLREWGYYLKGSPHVRDAIRHGCYWLLFSKEDCKQWTKANEGLGEG